ncbi:uncharacterized protein PRCAT00005591001 [Priceomyces carsonii]|uniref:uncharacterized protein n=1 Tax=Priceomyces carsonii TaxID=28549 RepID=UPI002ED889B6|nr:unnamed protein product [Priceomyces carsonii]
MRIQSAEKLEQPNFPREDQFYMQANVYLPVVRTWCLNKNADAREIDILRRGTEQRHMFLFIATKLSLLEISILTSIQPISI